MTNQWQAFPLHIVAAVMATLITAGNASSDETAAGSAALTTPLRGLIITGGCCHDYLRQTTILTQGLSQRINVRWTVMEHGSQRDIAVPLYRQKDWGNEYDFVIHNECFGGMTDVDFVESIVQEHLRAKLPAIFIHCSMHAYRDAETDHWRQLVGVTSVQHERMNRPLEVAPTSASHPVLAGFPKKWRTPNGELYLITNVWPAAEVLATAYSSEEQADQPVIWVNELDSVRVFGTTLGHHNETMQHSVWLDTTTRGILWACDRLLPDGRPMPGYEGTGLPGPVQDSLQSPKPAPPQPSKF